MPGVGCPNGDSLAPNILDRQMRDIHPRVSRECDFPRAEVCLLYLPLLNGKRHDQEYRACERQEFDHSKGLLDLH